MRSHRMPAVMIAAFAGLLSGCTNIASIEEAGPGKVGLARVAADIEARGETGTAVRLYKRAIEISGKHPDAYVGLGDIYRRAGNRSAALKAYQAALEKDPKHAGALLGLGTLELQQGDAESAVTALAAAAPQVNTAAAYNRLGIAQTMTGRLSEAQKSLSRALALAPSDIDIRTNLALAASLAGRHEAAIGTMRQVVGFEDAELRHHKNLVIVLVLAGRVDEARESAPRSLRGGAFNALVRKAKSISSMDDAKSRAKALGAISAG